MVLPWCSNPNPFYSSIANKKGPWLEVLIFLIRIQHLASACKVGLFQLTWKFILIARCHLMWKIILIVHCHHSSLVSDSFRVLSSNLCWTSVKCWHYKLTEYIWMVSVKSSLLFPAATLVFCGLIPNLQIYSRVNPWGFHVYLVRIGGLAGSAWTLSEKIIATLQTYGSYNDLIMGILGDFDTDTTRSWW